MTYTSLDLLRTHDSASAEKLRGVLQGQTYMNLDVCCAPDGGELQVSVSTTHEFDVDQNGEDELRDMVLHVLAFEATR